ncbi:MAG: alpha/beta fold hydrolase, partial [Woeseiaceae bacterium]
MTAVRRFVAVAALALSVGDGYSGTIAGGRARDFARLPQIWGAQVSPDGQYIAFFAPREGRTHLVVYSLGEQPRPFIMPPVETLDFDWLRWANEERLVFAMSFSGRRNLVETVETRLLAIDRDGSDLVSVVRPATRHEIGSRLPKELPAPQIQDRIVDWLVDDPAHLLLAVDADFDGRTEVRRVNIRDGKYEIVSDGTKGIQNWITDPSRQLRFGYGYRDDDMYFRLRHEDGGWTGDDLQKWQWGDYLPVAFTEDPSIAYVQGTNQSGRTVVRKLDLSTGEFTETVFEREAVDAHGLVLDSVTQRPVGVGYVDHTESVYYFDESMALLQRSIDRALPDTGNRIVNMSDDRQRVLILAASDVNPGVYYLWDREQKSLDIVGEVQPGLTPNVLAPVRSVSYEARDGTRIPGYLTLPRGVPPENLPTVVLPHGGPQARDTKSFWFLSQFLVSRGYAVLQPNFRGSTGYGDAFAKAGLKQWGGVMQDDVADGAEWLLQQGISDPDRLCIVGWSYGGYAAAMGAVKTPDLYRCAASINGVLDLPRHVSEEQDYVGGRVWIEHIGLDGESTKTVSPYHQAERIRIPLLIIQAEDDAIVTSEQGRRMAQRMRRL